MPGVIRVNDPNVVGGLAIEPVNSVLADGKPVCQAGTLVSPHPGFGKKPHLFYKLNPQGEPTVLVEGKPVAVRNLPDTCGHPRIAGSDTVIAG